MAHGPRKKPLDFDGNADHIMVRLGLGLRLGGGTIRMAGYALRLTRRLFNCNSFATLSALAEVCALLSVILFELDEMIVTATVAYFCVR